MVEFENLDLPAYKVSVLYKNGDVREFISNDFKRANQEFQLYYNFDFLSNSIFRVRFFNGVTGKTHFIQFD